MKLFGALAPLLTVATCAAPQLEAHSDTAPDISPATDLVIATSVVCGDDGWSADITARPNSATGDTWHLISGYDVVSDWMSDDQPYTFTIAGLTLEQSATTVGIQWRLASDAPETAPRFVPVTVDNPC